MEKKYEDAIMALSEIILDQGRSSQTKDWEIERLKAKIIELEKKGQEKETR